MQGRKHVSIPPPKHGLSPLIRRYRFLLCDVWGVLHDGGTAFAAAVAALERARQAGCRVIALSNSPKRASIVYAQLSGKGVGAQALDAVITSGELTRAHLEEAWAGSSVFHLGPAEDRDTLADLPLRETDDIERTDILVATGLRYAEPKDHDKLLARAAARGLDFLCANPDRVVRLGERREPCAGVLADRYATLGGHVLWMGKPDPRPYRACRKLFAELAGGDVPADSMLAIGDGLATDIAGGNKAGLSTLLIEQGLHREELASDTHDAVFERYGATPTYRMPRLVW